jgi:hypothetical protein
MMPTQGQFVRWCEDYYFDNRLEPGNPCHGDWESCHYPIPKCLGGSNTVLLLKEHHAIQGVLQSEEYDHPCIWGWEKSYLEAEILSLWRKWMKVKAQPARESWKKESPETKSEWGRKAQSLRSTESLRRNWERMVSKDPEILSNSAKKINSRRVRCLVTGKISTPGPLTLYQTARGIDPSLREEITND